MIPNVSYCYPNREIVYTPPHVFTFVFTFRNMSLTKAIYLQGKYIHCIVMHQSQNMKFLIGKYLGDEPRLLSSIQQEICAVNQFRNELRI